MRKSRAKKHAIAPDSRYGDPMVTRFVNNMMWDGKKSLAFKIFYDAMDIIEEKSSEEGHATWKKALQNVTPSVEVKSRRIGGSNLQIPIEIRGDRRISMAMKWLIMFSRKRSGKSMAEKLGAELLAASRGEGGTMKKKEDTHKMADSNRAFSHFRV